MRIDDGVSGLLHLAGVCVSDTEDVAGEFDHGALHTARQIPRNGMRFFAGEAHGLDLALDSAVTETGSDQNGRHLAELFGDVFGRNLSELT